MITQFTQITPNYTGPVSNVDIFPYRNNLGNGIWEVLGTEPSEHLNSKGVVVQRTVSPVFNLVVPCGFSGISLLKSNPCASSNAFSPLILSSEFFFVTTPENPNWDLYHVGTKGLQGIPLLGSRQEIAFIDNRHLCLLSAPSSKRVVTLPGRVAPHNIEVTSENPKEFIFRISASSSTLNGLYVSNLETGEIVKVP
jgi:hypothetical protein